MRASANEFFSLRVRWHGLITAVAALTTLASVLGFFGRYGWILDLFSHFRIQYVPILLLCSGYLFVTRKHRLACLSAALCLVNLATIAPYYYTAAASPGGDSLEVVQINVNTLDGQPSKVAELILDRAPDIVVLEEVDKSWFEALSPIEGILPHKVGQSRSDNFGVALYSRYPLANTEVLHLGEAQVPTISTRVLTPQGPLRIVATHTLPPLGAHFSRLRDQQLELLADKLRSYTGPVLLIGDLNTTHWSYHFRRLVDASGLIDCARGHGIHPTWHAGSPFIRIPIDHCLHSQSINILEKHLGPNVGSDHLPLIVKLSLTQTL